MQADVTVPGGAIVPTLRYRDVSAAIDWLCKAFGFEKHQVVNGEEGAVRYAELTFGSGMIMLGPVEDSAFDKLMTQPADAGGAETQICYLFVADARAHCARARTAGAEIILDIEDEASSGRGYSCRDPEGHIWNFGTYDPWKRSAQAVAPNRPPARLWAGLRRLAFAAVLVAAVVVSAVVVGWALGIADTRGELDPLAPASAAIDAGAQTQREQPAHDQRDAAERTIKEAREQLARERGAKEAAERVARNTQQQLAQESKAKDAAERAAKDVQAQLARERGAREDAERAAKEVQAQLAHERGAREDAERSAKEAREQLANAGAQRALEELREQLARERSALEAAQRTAEEARERLSLAERSAETVHEQLAAERSAREAAESVGRQMQEQLAKDRGVKEAAERAAREAREQEAKERAAARRPQQQQQRYRAVQPQQPAPSGRPFVNWDRE